MTMVPARDWFYRKPLSRACIGRQVCFSNLDTPPAQGLIAMLRPAEVARAAVFRLDSLVRRHRHRRRHLVADVRDAGLDVPVVVVVRVAEVAHRLAAVEAAGASAAGGIVAVIPRGAVVASRPAVADGLPAG